ncbi:RDD family protein [Nigerium massiliense]|uniref:RDD family protein n=1 Tax=Nigerium massiliense TaxID=1522317 RepID=UPI000590AD92|nr:RDD family protein [Nigerium massiliense]
MSAPEPYPGRDLGLPESGRGSLASWGSRVGALLVDWGVSMAVALLLFGPGVLSAGGWLRWMILTVFFVQKALLTAASGSSVGQLLSGVGVVRVDGRPVEWWRAIVRSALVCLVLPALIVGADRRALDDILLGTVVVNRRSRVNKPRSA